MQRPQPDDHRPDPRDPVEGTAPGGSRGFSDRAGNPQLQEICSHRLWVGHHDAQIDNDPEQLAESISLAVPLEDLVSVGPAHRFLHRTSSRIAGDIGFTATTTTPVAMQVEEHPDCSIVLVTQNSATYSVDGSDYRVQAGESAIFLPGMGYQLETGDGAGKLCSGLVYNLSPQLMARYLCELSPRSLNLGQALDLLERPHSLDLHNPQLKPVLYGLQLLVRTIDSLATPPPALDDQEAALTTDALMANAPERAAAHERPLLHLQEGIYALSAALLLPDQAERALASWNPLPPARRR
jgi:hypothetical protein